MKDEKTIRTFKELVMTLVECLEAIKIPYVIVGGATVGAFGIGRSTEDVDVLIKLKTSESTRIQQLAKCFQEKKLSVTAFELKAGIEEKGHVTVFDTLNPMVRIDLNPISTAMGEITFQRRIHLDLFDLGKKIWINSPESLIAVKLSPGFLSERDLKDVKGILFRSKETLDWDELRALCSKYEALEKLEELERQISYK
ncbi:MAG: DUF6036 family nucleotidyltransferase [Candidatus Hodarchaeota archaeon]